MISQEYQNELRSRFPSNVELCYGKRLPRKVPADLYEVLPVGKRCCLWFTYDKHNGGNTTFIVSNKDGQWFFEQVIVCFANELAYGTIFNGVLTTIYTPSSINKNGTNFFCADCISYYKGEFLGSKNFQKKIEVLTSIFQRKEISNIVSTNTLHIVMPFVASSYHEAQAKIGHMSYKTYGIRAISLRDRNPLGDIVLQPQSILNEKNIFLVKANSEPDCYSLYSKSENGNDNKFIGNSLIPTFKLSKEMNKLFRFIRENEKIDYIEESEDEEEFENIDDCKYLKNNVRLKMFCSYNQKFRKWVPVSLAPQTLPCSVLKNHQETNKVIRNHRINSNYHIKNERRKRNKF